MIKSYKELIVWQRSICLVVAVYKLAETFPKHEIFGLTSQMKRCAVSIPSNIAEGRNRGTRKDFLQFVRIAFGSGAELETQIIISKEIFKQDNFDFSEIDSILEEVMKMLNKMIQSLEIQS